MDIRHIEGKENVIEERLSRVEIFVKKVCKLFSLKGGGGGGGGVGVCVCVCVCVCYE